LLGVKSASRISGSIECDHVSCDVLMMLPA
jgi:hypothetical protein